MAMVSLCKIGIQCKSQKGLVAALTIYANQPIRLVSFEVLVQTLTPGPGARVGGMPCGTQWAVYSVVLASAVLPLLLSPAPLPRGGISTSRGPA